MYCFLVSYCRNSIFLFLFFLFNSSFFFGNTKQYMNIQVQLRLDHKHENLHECMGYVIDPIAIKTNVSYQ